MWIFNLLYHLGLQHRFSSNIFINSFHVFFYFLLLKRMGIFFYWISFNYCQFVLLVWELLINQIHLIVFYTFFIVSSRTCCRNNNFFENLCKILIIEKPKLTAIKLLYMMFTHVSIATFVYMVAENGRYFWRVFSVIYQQIAGKHKQKGFWFFFLKMNR